MMMELRTALMDEIGEEDLNASGLQLLAQAQSVGRRMGWMPDVCAVLLASNFGCLSAILTSPSLCQT